jgi:hypothetical protein
LLTGSQPANLLLFLLNPGVCFGIAFILNFIAILYRSLAAVPFFYIVSAPSLSFWQTWFTPCLSLALSFYIVSVLLSLFLADLLTLCAHLLLISSTL